MPDSAADNEAIARSSVVYVLVAATASSGPAPRSIDVSAAVANGEVGSLVMASVGAPWRRPASITATTSGDAPDWLIPTTSERSSLGCAP